MNEFQSEGNVGGLAPAEYRARAVLFTDLVEICERTEIETQYLKCLEDFMLTMENVGTSDRHDVDNEAFETLLGGLRYYHGILSVFFGAHPKFAESSFIS